MDVNCSQSRVCFRVALGMEGKSSLQPPSYGGIPLQLDARHTLSPLVPLHRVQGEDAGTPQSLVPGGRWYPGCCAHGAGRPRASAALSRNGVLVHWFLLETGKFFLMGSPAARFCRTAPLYPPYKPGGGGGGGNSCVRMETPPSCQAINSASYGNPEP